MLWSALKQTDWRLLGQNYNDSDKSNKEKAMFRFNWFPSGVSALLEYTCARGNSCLQESLPKWLWKNADAIIISPNSEQLVSTSLDKRMRSWMWLPLETQTNVRSRNGTCQHTLHLPAYFATKDKFSINSWEATHRSRESLGHRFYSNAITKRKRNKREEDASTARNKNSASRKKLSATVSFDPCQRHYSHAQANPTEAPSWL